MTQFTPITEEFLGACKRIARETKAGRRSWLRVEVAHRDRDNIGLVEACEEIEMPGCDPGSVTRRFAQPCQGRINNYGGAKDHTVWVATSSHYVHDDRSAIRTIASLCKVGDALIPHFIIGNYTDLLKEQGLAIDECYLGVFRPQGQLKWRCIGDIAIEHRVGPAGPGMMGYRR